MRVREVITQTKKRWGWAEANKTSEFDPTPIKPDSVSVATHVSDDDWRVMMMMAKDDADI